MTVLASNHAHRAPSIFEAVGSFMEAAEGVADLRVHREVDKTVEALLADRKFLHGHAGTGRSIINAIRTAPVVTGEYLDPDDELIDSLTELIDRDEDYLVEMTARKGCIDGDNRLNDTLCEVLHSAYDDFLVALACLIEVTKDMRAAITSKDLDAEPRGGATYNNVYELKRAMLA